MLHIWIHLIDFHSRMLKIVFLQWMVLPHFSIVNLNLIIDIHARNSNNGYKLIQLVNVL